MERIILLPVLMLSLALPALAQQDILKSSTAYVCEFLLIDDADHITGATGLTPTVTINKNGGSYSAPSGTVSEIAHGKYKIAMDATDTNTDGPINGYVAATASNDPADFTCGVVVEWDPRSVPTVADVVAAILDEAASGHTTAGTVGKKIGSLPDATAGAAGGVFIAGTNAETAITTGLTTHFIGTVDTLTTYTGNTPQTGDPYARLGAPAGASHAADVAAVKALLPTALVGGRMDTSVGAMANNTLTAAAIASDADTEIENSVLNATTAGHTTAGSIGKAIGDASSAGDPWSTAVPGAYSAGTAGYIIGNNIKPVQTVAKNVAFANFPIWMLSSSGSAQTGLSTSQIACQYSLDGGSWSSIADTTESEIGLGKYVVDLTSAETNGNALSVICTGPSGTQPYRTNITPQR